MATFGTRKAIRLRHVRYSSQMHSSHHNKGGRGWCADKEGESLLTRNCGCRKLFYELVSRGKRVDYLHPAALNLRAYILPMSPMPMSPTTKSSIPGGTAEDLAAMMQKLQKSVAIPFPKITSSRSKNCKQAVHRATSSVDALRERWQLGSGGWWLKEENKNFDVKREEFKVA